MRRLIDIDLRRRRLLVMGRRVHHAWLAVPILASDWGDRRVWLRDLIFPEKPEIGWPPARITVTDHRRARDGTGRAPQKIDR